MTMVLDREVTVGLTVRLELITPERAEKLLRKNTNNRKISQPLVDDYGRAMQRGEWLSNGETIKFTVSDQLIDGQHRLLACLKYRAPFYSLIAYGVPDNAFVTVDTGRRKSGADFAGALGCKYPNPVSAGIRHIEAIKRGVPDSHLRMSPAQIIERWQDDPSIEESAAKSYPSRHVIATGIGTALHYLFARHDRSMADSFFTDLATGVGLEANDPVYRLRERLLQERRSRSTKLRSTEVITLAIRAWNHRRSGRGVTILRGRVTASDDAQLYPEIE